MADKEIPFYNIAAAVGPGCPNKRTDVMLVQFFLHQIYAHPTKARKRPAGPDIQINGQFDATTAIWVRHFQDDLKGQGKPVLADGRVDRARGEHFSNSSISKTLYTISFLNTGHCIRFRQDHDHLERHPLIPGELKAELFEGEPKLVRD